APDQAEGDLLLRPPLRKGDRVVRLSLPRGPRERPSRRGRSHVLPRSRGSPANRGGQPAMPHRHHPPRAGGTPRLPVPPRATLRDDPGARRSPPSPRHAPGAPRVVPLRDALPTMEGDFRPVERADRPDGGPRLGPGGRRPRRVPISWESNVFPFRPLSPAP